MACVNTIAAIATEILSDLENDASLSSAFIETWLTNNIGGLNIAINTGYSISTDGEEYVPCMEDTQKSIYKWMFMCYYWNLLARRNLGATGYDWSEITEADSRIRRVSKNEIAKNYMSIAKDCMASLKEIIKYYKLNQCLPSSMSSWNSPTTLYPRVNDPHSTYNPPYPYLGP